MNVRKIRYVSINHENWKISTCSCWWWLKNYKCKHMIAICQRLGRFEWEIQHKAIASC